MELLRWEQSGVGPLPMDLDQVKVLALQSGFVFDKSDESTPPLKRANLQALFRHFDVNTLSAFKQKFFNERLQVEGKLAEVAGLREWKCQHLDGETYWGEYLLGRRHGKGVLFYQAGPSTARYDGEFVQGQKEGVGVTTTSKGEKHEGCLKEGILWGPGVFEFASPAAAGAARYRVRFEGVFNGKPMGTGVMIWSDGQQEHGMFDGFAKQDGQEEDPAPCAAAAATARSNAADAREVQAEIADLLQKHGRQAEVTTYQWETQ